MASCEFKIKSARLLKSSTASLYSSSNSATSLLYFQSSPQCQFLCVSFLATPATTFFHVFFKFLISSIRSLISLLTSACCTGLYAFPDPSTTSTTVLTASTNRISTRTVSRGLGWGLYSQAMRVLRWGIRWELMVVLKSSRNWGSGVGCRMASLTAWLILGLIYILGAQMHRDIEGIIIYGQQVIINSNMRSQRSMLSSSYQQQRPKCPEPSHGQASIYEQLSEELAQIRRELKSKVNRNEFISSLSSKLSISQLAALTMGNIASTTVGTNVGTHVRQQQYQNKQNKTNNRRESKQYEYELEILRKQMMAVQHKNKEVNQRLSLQIEQFRDKFQILDQLSSRVQSQATARHTQRSKITQLQAYAFKKADRSQLDKLFTLNELLVIEIEQAKQRAEEQGRNCWARCEMAVRDLEAKMGRKLMEGLEGRLLEGVRQMEARIGEEMSRVLAVIQEKHKEQDTHERRSQSKVESLQTQLHQMQHQLTTGQRQLLTRLNLLQLKPNPNADCLAEQLQTLKLDISNLYDRSTQVNANMAHFCHSVLSQTQSKVESRLRAEMDLSAQQILRKVVQLGKGYAAREDLESILSEIREKMKQLHAQQQEHVRKLDFLDAKQREMIEAAEEEVEKTEQRLSLIAKQLQSRAHVRKIAQLEQKSITIDEIKEISREIGKKIDTDITKVVAEQNKINTVLCSENIVAKWLWSSATLKGGNLVAWDCQIVNTLPQNYKWNKNQPQILISKSGYYRIEMGFYSKKKPTTQLIVNGQTIMSAVNSNSYVLHHSSGKLKDVSNGEIAGLTYVDYLLLPENARVAISYMGEFVGEGFLVMHRI